MRKTVVRRTGRLLRSVLLFLAGGCGRCRRIRLLLRWGGLLRGRRGLLLGAGGNALENRCQEHGATSPEKPQGTALQRTHWSYASRCRNCKQSRINLEMLARPGKFLGKSPFREWGAPISLINPRHAEKFEEIARCARSAAVGHGDALYYADFSHYLRVRPGESHRVVESAEQSGS